MTTTASERARRWRERRSALIRELDDFPRPPWQDDATALALSRWFARQLTEDRMSVTVISAVSKELGRLADRFALDRT
jgi:hypothetical protein